MKWIGRGTLRVSDKLTLNYGDEIPEGLLTKERVKTFKKLGKVGEIVERINEHPEVRALKAQIARRDEKIDKLKDENKKLVNQIAELKAIPSGDEKLLEEIEKLKGEIEEFELLHTDLEGKKDGEE